MLVSGSNAVFVDLDQRIADRLPVFIGLVILIALIILMTVFRSILVPLKASAMNLLTIFATYGVIVMVFTYGWGWSRSASRTMCRCCRCWLRSCSRCCSGLSNDYEVYLVSRMHEEYALHGDARLATKRGHALGSRIVIAAALIMIFVFASYIFQPGTAVKEFGLGMAVAIVIDAFIARMIILPAVMHLGNSKMWWFPRWLDRILPRVDTEGGAGAECWRSAEDDAGRSTDKIPGPSPGRPGGGEARRRRCLGGTHRGHPGRARTQVEAAGADAQRPRMSRGRQRRDGRQAEPAAVRGVQHRTVGAHSKSAQGRGVSAGPSVPRSSLGLSLVRLGQRRTTRAGLPTTTALAGRRRA